MWGSQRVTIRGHSVNMNAKRQKAAHWSAGTAVAFSSSHLALYRSRRGPSSSASFWLVLVPLVRTSHGLLPRRDLPDVAARCRRARLHRPRTLPCATNSRKACRDRPSCCDSRRAERTTPLVSMSTMAYAAAAAVAAGSLLAPASARAVHLLLAAPNRWLLDSRIVAAFVRCRGTVMVWQVLCRQRYWWPDRMRRRVFGRAHPGNDTHRMYLASHEPGQAYFALPLHGPSSPCVQSPVYLVLCRPS